MRKRTVKNLANTIFWYLLYFLPIILYIGYVVMSSGVENNALIDFSQFLQSIGIVILHDNLITSTLLSIFSYNGIFPIFNANYNGIYLYFSYFICVYLIHLLVDVLLFIPKLAHKWMNSFTSEE